MSAEDQQNLINFLNSGKSIYIEGTNIGMDHQGTDFWNYFGANYIGRPSEDNYHEDFQMLFGSENSFTDDFEIPYIRGSYADVFINRLSPSSGYSLLESNDGFGRVIANSQSNYRTIASSLIFGAMIDQSGLQTKNQIMKTYLTYLLHRDNPKIELSSNEINFGLINPGQSAEINLDIQNIGTNDLNLLSITSMGEGYVFDHPDSQILSFGQIFSIPISFSPEISGTYNGSISLMTNDPENPIVSINVTGSMYENANLEFPEIINANIQPNGSNEVEFTLNNTGELDLDYWITASEGIGNGEDYHYQWVSSDDEFGPDFIWNDISEIGEELIFEDYNSSIQLDLETPFPFYGVMKDYVIVSSNGYVTFRQDGIDPSNDPIPSPIYPNDFVAGFWDNLSPENGSAYYYFAEDGLIIQYNNFTFFSYDGSLTFQIILKNNGDIYLNYYEMEGNLNTASIGIEDYYASNGLEIAYNENFVHNDMSIKISTQPNWVTIHPNRGSIEMNTPESILLSFDANQINSSTTGEIIIHSNDPENPIVAIPLNITLDVGNTDDVSATTSLNLVNYPNPFIFSNQRSLISFSFSAPEKGDYTLEVFNTKGQKVYDEKHPIKKTGKQIIYWNPNNNNTSISSGVYFARIKNKKYSDRTKILIIK